MPAYTQSNRPLTVTTPLGADVLLLESFQGHEAISELFQFELGLLAENKTPVAFERLMGQGVTVEMALRGGGKRHFHGIVNRFSQGRRDETFTHYRAVLVPRLWLWTKKVQSRIFQHLTIPEILEQVLPASDVTWEAGGTYHPRDYVVQYRESDFAFASRLMEEEGIYYFFKHAVGRHELVVTDVPNQHPDVPGPVRVIYDEVEGGKRDEVRVTAWEKTQELRAGKVTLWDHCFELPGKNLAAQQPTLDGVAVGQVNHRLQVGGNDKLELYDYPGRYAQRFDGVDKGGGDRPADLKKIFEDNRRTAKIRMEQETVPALEVRGAGTGGHFVPGHQFTLTRHFDADGPYLLTRVDHAARQTGFFRSGAEAKFEYQNTFTAIPALLPFRPPLLTPRPFIPGTQTATVVGPKGEEVFVDKYGRVKVQFPWDRQGKKDANSSCWIRVAQSWAGKGWGAFFWPRIGHEVVVAFEEGDPDRPLVTGSVYNGENMPPFKLPGNRLVNGIKSCSMHGKRGNFNGLVFYDELGNEHVQLHSEKHQIATNEVSQHTHVGGTSTRVVGGLRGLGSGSGGGGGEGANGPGGGEGGEGGGQAGSQQPFAWEASDVLGRMADDLEFTFGQKSEVTVGFSWEDSIGLQREFTVDPLFFLGEFSMPVLVGLGAMLGKSEVTLGADCGMLYGPKVEIHRGNKIEYEAELLDSFSTGQLLSAISVAGALVMGATAGKWDSLKEADNAWFVTNLVRQVLMGLATMVESVKGIAENATTKADEVEALAQRALAILQLPTRDLATWVQAIADAAEVRAFDIAKLVKAGTEMAAAKAKASPGETANENKVLEGNYTLKTFDMSLVSASPEAPAPGAAKGTAILIDAKGSGKNGVLWLNGTGTAMLTCDTACVAIRKKGKQEVLIECDATGEITVHQGDIINSPRIKLTSKGITLSVGPDAKPLSTITMTQTGIKLAVMDQNTIELTPKGIEINGLLLDLKAKIKASLEGILVEKKGKAVIKHQGTFTTIGP